LLLAAGNGGALVRSLLIEAKPSVLRNYRGTFACVPRHGINDPPYLRVRALERGQGSLVLDGDQDAESVLRELVDHPDANVNALAHLGLCRLHSGERGAVITITASGADHFKLSLDGLR
jgi:hypothetical protein